MPPKNNKKPAGGKSGGDIETKESKGGTSVKVRHILCEKQVKNELLILG